MQVLKTQREYDYTPNNIGWIGGKFDIPNQSTGYHGILKQWWNAYKTENASWLLISEKNHVKPYFKTEYPNDTFKTLEYFAENNEVDYRYDLCDRNLPTNVIKFDLIVCQATLEHIYDPYSAILNMINLLNKDGILTIHTHTPHYPYHPYPRDYLRYHPDWFLDIPNTIRNVELLELFDASNDNDDLSGHIFSCYKKL